MIRILSCISILYLFSRTPFGSYLFAGNPRGCFQRIAAALRFGICLFRRSSALAADLAKKAACLLRRVKQTVHLFGRDQLLALHEIFPAKPLILVLP